MSAWSVPDIAGKISADAIHIAVNLNGYTKVNSAHADSCGTSPRSSRGHLLQMPVQISITTSSGHCARVHPSPLEILHIL